MFDVGWSEMALIAIVALVFIGPKELPQVLRTVGKWVTTARGMAREFQGHVDDMIRDSDLEEVRKSIRDNAALHLDDLANQIDPDRQIRDSVNPDALTADLKASVSEPAATKSLAGEQPEALPQGGDYHPPEATTENTAEPAAPSSAAEPAAEHEVAQDNKSDAAPSGDAEHPAKAASG